MAARIINYNPNLFRIVIPSHPVDSAKKRGVKLLSEMSYPECKIFLENRLIEAEVLPREHSLYNDIKFKRGDSLIYPRLIKIDKEGLPYRCVYAVKRNKNKLIEKLLCVHELLQFSSKIASIEEIATIIQ